MNTPKIFNHVNQAKFIRSFFDTMIDHGLNEDGRNHLEYNDEDKISEYLQEICKGEKSLKEIDAAFRGEFDEEFDIVDSLWGSVAIELKKLFTQHQLGDNTIQNGGTSKVQIRHTWSFKCPYCNAHSNWGSKPELKQTCNNCNGTYDIYLPAIDEISNGLF